jgi:uncharacterized integral membrane protein
MSNTSSFPTYPTYQGQFGEFTITDQDCWGVIIYRSGLTVAAISFVIATGLVFWYTRHPNLWFLQIVSYLYVVFVVALGVSLATIHIYMVSLHRLLQVFWLIGAIASLIFAISDQQSLVLTVNQYPLTILGIGFLFAALTGIYFKEAFCFNRLETKFLTPLVPILLLGHLTGTLPDQTKLILLAVWAGLFLVFAGRKSIQNIPDDIGDKSVFTYLHEKGNG